MNLKNCTLHLLLDTPPDDCPACQYSHHPPTDPLPVERRAVERILAENDRAERTAAPPEPPAISVESWDGADIPRNALVELQQLIEYQPDTRGGQHGNIGPRINIAPSTRTRLLTIIASALSTPRTNLIAAAEARGYARATQEMTAALQEAMRDVAYAEHLQEQLQAERDRVFIENTALRQVYKENTSLTQRAERMCSECDALKLALATAQREIEHLKAINLGNSMAASDDWMDAAEAGDMRLQQRLAVLGAALKTYGTHQISCQRFLVYAGECTCGFDALLTADPQEKTS